MRVSKLAMIFATLFLCVLMASPVMAFNVTNRSAEMDDFSPCDRAGTIEMRLTEADWNLIGDYLANNEFVKIRIALNGLSLPANPTLPRLCKDIHGTATAIGAQGGAVAYPGELVAVQTIGVEVSDAEVGCATGVADLDVYVHGNTNDRYIEVYITKLEGPAVAYDFSNDPPWFKIGLHNELLAAPVPDTETTPICAQVSSFSGVSTLTISNEAIPNTLTFSGDNEIGHFLTLQVSLNDCDKTRIVDCAETETIENCPLGDQACGSWKKCFVMAGDLPDSGDIQIIIRTNGAADGDNTQEGIYLKEISAQTETGTDVTPAWLFFKADGITAAALPCAAWESEYAIGTIDAADAATVALDGDELRFCVTYASNPDEVQVNTDARFWVQATQVPCGNIVSGVLTGAAIEECGAGSACMYFPYVILNSSPWFTGIVITNLDNDAAAADMEATLTLTDSTGAVFTYVKDDFTSPIWVFGLDSIISEFGGGTPAAGAAWLKVETNFSVDGYEFMTDGTFGAGTLPRLSCGGN